MRVAPRRTAAPLLALLAAALAACAAAQPQPLPQRPHPTGLPQAFANEGAPDFLNVGLAYRYNQSQYGMESGATGYFLDGFFTFTYLGENGVHIEQGEYLSWECTPEAPVNGTFRALVRVTTTYPDGSVSEPVVMCQTAILDLDPDGPWLDWGMSAEECPHYTNVSFELLSYQLLELRQNVCGDPTPEWDTADEEPPPPPDVLPVEIETPPSGKPFTPGREDAQ